MPGRMSNGDSARFNPYRSFDRNVTPINYFGEWKIQMD
jgi:hypothetical protein